MYALEGYGRECALWMQAYGVDAVIAGDDRQHSRDAHRAFINGKKFAPYMTEILRDGHDAVCRVPRRSRSLAHVVPRTALPRDAPLNAADVAQLEPYVAALEDETSPTASFTWQGASAARIEADLAADQAISVQVTHHPGWRAMVGSQPARLYRDGFGQIVIEPARQGHCVVDMVFDGGVEGWAASICSWLALITGLTGTSLRLRPPR